MAGDLKVWKEEGWLSGRQWPRGRGWWCRRQWPEPEEEKDLLGESSYRAVQGSLGDKDFIYKCYNEDQN